MERIGRNRRGGPAWTGGEAGYDFQGEHAFAETGGYAVTPPFKYDASILTDSNGLAWGPYAPEGYPAGLSLRVLRRLDDGQLRSAILDIPPGWSSSGARTAGVAEQGYILSGRIDIAGVAFEAGAFYFVAAGAAFGPIHSADGAQMVLILDGDQSYGEADAAASGIVDRIIAADLPTIEQVVGVKRRVLWQDPVTGADTRHLTLPVGLSGLGAEWHPVNEEIFFLTSSGPAEGDEAGPGWFLFNPAYAVHGGQRTTTTVERTLLEWHDGKWELNRV